MKKKKFVSIVVYLKNSEKYISQFLAKTVATAMAEFTQVELVCVDDGCTDNTMQIIDEWRKNHTENLVINIVHMSGTQGLENAMNAGRDFSIGDFVFEFDDCFVDYDSDLLNQMYEKVISGYDIVSAGITGNRGASGIFYGIYNANNRKGSNIGTETCRVLSRRAINRIKNMGTYIPYRKAVYANCGLANYKITYVSSDEKGRKKLKTRTMERVGLAFDSFVYFTNFLEKLSMFLSIGFLLATVVMAIYVLANQFLQTKPIEGWMSTMVFLSFGFFGVFLLLTIVLKYLSILLNLVFKQNHYVIRDVEKVDANRE